MLLEQDTTRKEWVDKNGRQIEFDAGNSKEYKVEAIWDNTVYANKLEQSHLSGLYYLMSSKSYSEKENTWKPTSVV